ncbi:hypothetical protein GOP80_10580 [Planococcaceae bacterium Storch 2/2-2]|nr:hypothetical protein [Planococcaceae bacterium Storch 2/2-2]
MKLRDFVLGVVTGVAATVAVQRAMSEMAPYAPADAVLSNVKETFLKEGPIEGSWIVMEPETYEKNVLTLDVYRGGITRMENGKVQQYEFIADAQTGTVIDVIQK